MKRILLTTALHIIGRDENTYEVKGFLGNVVIVVPQREHGAVKKYISQNPSRTQTIGSAEVLCNLTTRESYNTVIRLFLYFFLSF